jgi:hypothetical protein
LEETTMKMQSITAVAAATLIAFGVATPAQANHLGGGLTAPVEFLGANLDFETGDRSGWGVSETGSCRWATNTGVFDPPGGGVPQTPIEGSFDQVSFQSGPGQCRLTKTIIAPIDVGLATLSWSDRIRSNAALSDNNQEWRVLARTNAGAFVAEIFSTDPGDAAIQIGPNARSFDVTVLLAAREGIQTRFSWEEEDNLGFFNATLDIASLIIQLADADNDGVTDSFDLCPGTIIPEAVVPSDGEVLVNHFALFDHDLNFDTTAPYGGGAGPGKSYTTTDTGGCSCEQIIAEQGLGKGHVMKGCSISAMDDWVALVPR